MKNKHKRLETIQYNVDQVLKLIEKLHTDSLFVRTHPDEINFDQIEDLESTFRLMRILMTRAVNSMRVYEKKYLQNVKNSDIIKNVKDA